MWPNSPPVSRLNAANDLAVGQTYYWKVVAKNAGGTTSTNVWSFTVH